MNIVAGTLTGLFSFYRVRGGLLRHPSGPLRRSGDAWRSSVESKLKVVQEIFEILNRRAATYRAEALEMTIIILIALEIVLSFLR